MLSSTVNVVPPVTHEVLKHQTPLHTATWTWRRTARLLYLLGKHRPVGTQETVGLSTLRLTHVEHLTVGLHVSVDPRELLLSTVEVGVGDLTEHRVVNPGLSRYRPHLQALLCCPHHVLQGQPHSQRGQVRQLGVPKAALLPRGELRSALVWE